MRHKYLLTRKAKRRILVRAALTVGDHPVELTDEAFPKFTTFWRSQAPAEDFSSAFVHPAYGGGGSEIARIGFHDQRIGIPIFEPANESALKAKVQRTAEQMKIIRHHAFCGLRFPIDDHLCATGFSGKQTQPAFAMTCEQVKERDSIRRQDALLQTQFAGEPVHCALPRMRRGISRRLMHMHYLPLSIQFHHHTAFVVSGDLNS